MIKQNRDDIIEIKYSLSNIFLFNRSSSYFGVSMYFIYKNLMSILNMKPP